MLDEYSALQKPSVPGGGTQRALSLTAEIFDMDRFRERKTSFFVVTLQAPLHGSNPVATVMALVKPHKSPNSH